LAHWEYLYLLTLQSYSPQENIRRRSPQRESQIWLPQKSSISMAPYALLDAAPAAFQTPVPLETCLGSGGGWTIHGWGSERPIRAFQVEVAPVRQRPSESVRCENLNNDYREMGPVAGERKRALRRSRDFRLPVRAGKIKLIIRLHPIPGLRSLQGGIQSAVGYALRPPSLDGMRSCGRRPRAKNQPHDRIAGSLAGLDAAACVRLAAVRWRRRLTILQTGSCRLRKRRIRRGSGRVHSSK